MKNGGATVRSRTLGVRAKAAFDAVIPWISDEIAPARFTGSRIRFRA